MEHIEKYCAKCFWSEAEIRCPIKTLFLSGQPSKLFFDEDKCRFFIAEMEDGSVTQFLTVLEAE